MFMHDLTLGLYRRKIEKHLSFIDIYTSRYSHLQLSLRIFNLAVAIIVKVVLYVGLNYPFWTFNALFGSNVDLHYDL